MTKKFLFLFIIIFLVTYYSPSFCSEQPLDLKVQESFKNASSINAIKAEINLLMKNKKGEEAKKIFNTIKNYFKGNEHRELVISYTEDTFNRNLYGGENNNEEFYAKQNNIQPTIIDKIEQQELDKKQDTIKEDQNINTSKQIDKSFKQEFINLIYLLQNYNIHAKNLSLLLKNYNRDEIKEKLKEELKKDNLNNYQNILAATNKLEKDSKNYQQKLAYIKELAEKDCPIQTLEELNKKENNLDYNKLIHLMEALYLISTTETQIDENKQLGKKLLLQYHPDKISTTKNDNNDNIEFIGTLAVNKHTHPLLKDNKANNNLNKFQNEIKNIIIPEPSFIEQSFLNLTTLITDIAAQTIGYDMFGNIRPYMKAIPGTITAQKIDHSIFNDDNRPNIRSTTELQQICKNSMIGHFLILEQKLQTLKRYN